MSNCSKQDSPFRRYFYLFICLGAVGDTGRYVITGDVYIGNIIQKKWKRVEANGNAPTNRAAH